MLTYLATLAILSNAATSSPRVLVFSKTAGYRHDAIHTGVEVIRKLCKENGFPMEATEDASRFTDGNLANKEVVIFLLTTQDVLDEDQQTAFVRFIRSGGGFIGIHSAADTEYDWEWYGELVGAYFRSHPPVQKARVIVEDPAHFTMRSLPRTSEWMDEWYDYRQNPRPHVKVLATVDESSYTGGVMGNDHPIIWCREFDGGRSWYTGLGHTIETWNDARFQMILRDAILWVARRAD